MVAGPLQSETSYQLQRLSWPHIDIDSLSCSAVDYVKTIPPRSSMKLDTFLTPGDISLDGPTGFEGHEQVTHDQDRPPLTENLRGARETAELAVLPSTHDALLPR
jgi:hypothetical protein